MYITNTKNGKCKIAIVLADYDYASFLAFVRSLIGSLVYCLRTESNQERKQFWELWPINAWSQIDQASNIWPIENLMGSSR